MVPARPSSAGRRRYGAFARRALERALAVPFGAAGIAKVAGVPAMVVLFGTIGNTTGVGAWFRVAVGLAELAGALLLCAPSFAGVGAVGLAVVMIGAILTHAVVLHTTAVAPAALLAPLAVVAHAHRAALAVFAARVERNL